jgi:hypothetical protein
LTIDLRSIKTAFRERAAAGLDPEERPLFVGSVYERANKQAEIHARVTRNAPDRAWWQNHTLWDEWSSEETVNRMATEGTVLAHMAAQTDPRKRDFWREVFADVWAEVKAEMRQMQPDYIPLPLMRSKRGERPLHEWGNRRGQPGWQSIRDPEFDGLRTYYDVKRGYQAGVSVIDLSRYLTRTRVAP